MPITQPFERYSDLYDQWFLTHSDLYEAELNAVRASLPPPGADILEVGVGSGKFAAPLGIGLGVEPCEQMAARARKLGIEVVAGVAEQLPFADGRFDAVLMVTTICFVEDVTKSMRETYRVLKPGGCVVVGFVDKDSEMGRQYERKRQQSKFYEDATFFSPGQVMGHLQRAGFELASVTQTLLLGDRQDELIEGFGEGAFVVVKGIKPGRAST